MKWFKHDSDASQDAKLKKLLIHYGYEGYGLYFHCLELICGDLSDKNFTFELEHDAEILANEGRILQTKVEEIMRFMVDLGLFESVKRCKCGVLIENIRCASMLKRLDSSMTSNKILRQIIALAKDDIENGKVMTESCKIRLDKTRIDKNRKEKEKGERFTPPTLEEVTEFFSENSWPKNEAEKFFYHYESIGWMVGKRKMKKWKMAASGWNKRFKEYNTPKSQSDDILNSTDWIKK